MNEKEKVTVLLVDDEEHIRKLMKVLVSSINAEVIAEAENGKDAIELYRKNKPHITLMDINMPVMNGKEALKQIKSEFPEAIIIMLTSLSSMDVVEECIEAGASNYIRKDAPLNEIKKLIKDTWTEYIKSIKGKNG